MLRSDPSHGKRQQRCGGGGRAAAEAREGKGLEQARASFHPARSSGPRFSLVSGALRTLTHTSGSGDLRTLAHTSGSGDRRTLTLHPGIQGSWGVGRRAGSSGGRRSRRRAARGGAAARPPPQERTRRKKGPHDTPRLATAPRLPSALPRNNGVCSCVLGLVASCLGSVVIQASCVADGTRQAPLQILRCFSSFSSARPVLASLHALLSVAVRLTSATFCPCRCARPLATWQRPRSRRTVPG